MGLPQNRGPEYRPQLSGLFFEDAHKQDPQFAATAFCFGDATGRVGDWMQRKTQMGLLIWTRGPPLKDRQCAAAGTDVKRLSAFIERLLQPCEGM